MTELYRPDVLLSSTGGRRSEQEENSSKIYVVANDTGHVVRSHTDPRKSGTTGADGREGDGGAVP